MKRLVLFCLLLVGFVVWFGGRDRPAPPQSEVGAVQGVWPGSGGQAGEGMRVDELVYGGKEVALSGREMADASAALESLPGNEQASLWVAFAEARRAVSTLTAAQAAMPQNEGVHLFAANPGQQLTARFKAGEVKIESGQGGDWQGTLRTELAQPGSETVPQRGVAGSGRVEYAHPGGMTEWYENGSAGIEHGFKVERRPEGLTGGKPLRIDVVVEGLWVERAAGDKEELLLVDAGSGEPKLRYGEVKVWDGTGRELGASYEVGKDRFAIVVADGEATYPVMIDPLITSEEAKLGPEFTGDGAESDFLGYSVAVSGDTVVVGAYGDDTAAAGGAGSAYVFVRSGVMWSQQAKLEAGDGAAGDNFGYSVAVSGDTALVGAYGDDTAAVLSVGSAYVFERSGEIWSQPTKLVAVDGAAGDSFGYSVAVSGDTVLVGAHLDDKPGAADAGSAYVFARSGGLWSQQAKLLAGDGAARDNFGGSVAVSSDTVLVGAYSDDMAAGNNVGSAYVFVRSGVMWSQQAKLLAGDGAAFDSFGWSVSVSGNTALVGAYLDDTAAGGNAGSAYVFVRSGVMWSQQARLEAGDGAEYDFFGRSVSVSGDTMLVGAYQYDTTAGVNAGSAYVFVRSGAMWSQQAKLEAGDGAGGDSFGYSVAVSGDTALVGAYLDDTAAGADAGSAYVYERSGVIWGQQAKLEAGDGAGGDYFGNSVSVSGDTALVGAYADDTVEGADVGSVYVFVLSGGLWTQQAKLEAGDGAGGDYFGNSVSVSGDTALVGAYADDTTAGVHAGSAYVFVRSGGIWSQQEKLEAGDGAVSDYFGNSVSVSGDTALVGAFYDDTTAGTDVGSAYVFERSGGVWSQQAKLLAGDGEASDNFGISVSVSGDTALVGAYFDNTAAGSNAGSAYVFVRGEGLWSQQSKLEAGDGAANNYFGYSVSVSGDTVLVGAYGNATMAGAESGSAYVFERSGGVWSPEAKLVAGDGAASDQFGRSVSVFGDTALVGAHLDDTTAGSNVGSAYVFERSGGLWSQQSKLLAGDGAASDGFGRSVSVFGDTALVGAPSDDTAHPTTGDLRVDHGSVYVFRIEKVVPEIAVEQPAATGLTSGVSGVDFGSSVVGVAGSPLTFTVRNVGTAGLTGLGISFGGDHGSDYAVTASPTAPVVAAGSTMFEVTFTPGGAGARTATLQIASNDADEDPFEIALSGVGEAVFSAWATANGVPKDPTALGANGLANGLNFAFGVSPAAGGRGMLDYAGTFAGGGTLVATGLPVTRLEGGGAGTEYRALFVRRVDHVAAGLVYTPRFSEDLIIWDDSTDAPVVLADDGTHQVVSVPYPELMDGNPRGAFRVKVRLGP